MPAPLKPFFDVTKESIHMFVLHVVTTHDDSLPSLRRKLDKTTLEELSKLAALTHAIASQAVDDLPAGAQPHVEDKLTKPFIANDANIMLELQSALYDLDMNLSWKEELQNAQDVAQDPNI